MIDTAWPYVSTRRPSRVGMWCFLGLQGIMLFIMMVMVGYTVTSSSDSCTFGSQVCNDITGWGAAVAFLFVLLVWAALDIIAGLTYIVIRMSRS